MYQIDIITGKNIHNEYEPIDFEKIMKTRKEHGELEDKLKVMLTKIQRFEPTAVYDAGTVIIEDDKGKKKFLCYWTEKSMYKALIGEY